MHTHDFIERERVRTVSITRGCGLKEQVNSNASVTMFIRNSLFLFQNVKKYARIDKEDFLFHIAGNCKKMGFTKL